MLIKSKVFVPQSDPRLKAGDEAERQMAFLLDRRFEDRDDVFVLHDLRIQKGKYAFQIDHLVVTRYGIALIESKSIHSTVSITRHDEKREHWSRTFRGREEGIGDQMATRARLSAASVQPALDQPGVDVRTHATPLYNSIYRFDDQALVNLHAYGWQAPQNPVLHLRRIPGGRLFDHYLTSFDRVWSTGQDLA